jgi:hypothetical protein
MRTNCCICNNNLKKLVNFEKYPIKFSMTHDTSFQYADLNFSICIKCNTLQLNNLIDVNLLYDNPHNSNIVGHTWNQHFILFSKFINSNCTILKRVLEIGGSSDKIVKNFNELYSEWILMDPNAEKYTSNKILTINKFFDKQFKIEKKINTIIHSHLLEHLYTPLETLRNMHNILEDDGNMFVSVPNMEYYSKITPFLNIHFEHTYFLNEINSNYIFTVNNFKIITKEYFMNHSIFYHLKKEKTASLSTDTVSDYNIKFLNVFYEKINYFKNLVEEINRNIENKINVFLFGCHTNTQLLLYMKLNVSNIKYILDNDESKQDKYFYGSTLICKSPNIIEKLKNPIVICHIGAYTDEVKVQLKSINSSVLFF